MPTFEVSPSRTLLVGPTVSKGLSFGTNPSISPNREYDSPNTDLTDFLYQVEC